MPDFLKIRKPKVERADITVNAVLSATAIITLCQIGRLDVLKKMYGRVSVPQAVYDEICVDEDSFAAVELERNLDWIEVVKIENTTNKALYRSALHVSEAELLTVARELAKQGEHVLLVVDEIAAKRHAKASGFRVTGTLGVIYRAQKEGYLDEAQKDIKPIIDSMEQQKIHIGGRVASYFKAKPKRRRKKLSRVDKIIVNSLSVIILIITFFLVRELYGQVTYRIDLWRNEQLQRDIRDMIGTPGEWIGDLIQQQPSRTIVTSPEDFGDFIVQYNQGNAGEQNRIFLASPPERAILQPIQQIVELRERLNNNDVIGYIYIDGPLIRGRPIASGPIVQGTDNVFYLTHLPDRRRNSAGSIFADHRNSPMFTDHNNILYAHNMFDRSKFGNIREFNNEAFARANQYIQIVTMYEVTVWRVFAAYWINVEQPLAFNYILNNFETREAHQAFLDEIRRRASADRPVPAWRRAVEGGLFYLDYGVTVYDTILTLSTCTNYHDDERHVVHAFLVDRSTPPQ